MHNVNILTIHKEPNYGAVLQAYALYKTIENLGHVPYIINLDMDYSRFPYSLKYRVLLGLHKWMKGYSDVYKRQGHKSIKTTQIYLKGFELSERTKVNRLNYSYVMNFKTI